MATNNYNDEKSLESIDEVLKFSSEVLLCEHVVITEGMKISPPINFILMDEFGAEIGTGATKIEIGSAGIGVALGSSIIRAGATGLISATVGGVLLPFIAPIALLSGIGHLFKNEKDKELYKKKLFRYKEAITKQNEIIKKYQDLERRRVETEEIQKVENCEVRAKINELRAVNEALLKLIKELSNDLEVA